jgi:hypothetical protein
VIRGPRIDANLQGVIEGKTYDSPSVKEILSLSYRQDGQIPNGAKDRWVFLGIVAANEKNMARPGLIRCLHGSNFDMPPLWHNVFCQLDEGVSEIDGAKPT